MSRSSPDMRWSRETALILALLLLGVFAAYYPALENDFVFFDDQTYIYENPYIADGLSLKSFFWSFNIGYAANWHPLTWVSHALDVTLFGLNPRGHHAVNVALHAINAVLLFLFLGVTTRERWKSAFAAALFALHPLHVESVAWASERKDVLSTLFFMLVLLAYCSYAASPSKARYLLVLVLTALGLMSKPMLVTVPLVLLILDYWPLKRSASIRRLLVEKLPLFALSAGSSILTLLAQRPAMAELERIPLPMRLANALVSYLAYLSKTVWPANLAIQYPYPKAIPLWLLVMAGVFAAGPTLAAVRLRKRFPFIFAGWAWYIVTLLPVIGIVQVGSQPMADRYTYIPLIGIFLILAWGLPAVLSELQVTGRKIAVTCSVSAVLVLGVLVFLSNRQVRVWSDSVELFEHAAAVSPDSVLPHSNLVTVYVRGGDLKKAEYHARRVVEIEPGGAKGLAKLAWVLSLQQRTAEAERAARQAIKADPGYAPAYLQLGDILDASGNLTGAQEAYLDALRLRPGYLEAHTNLAAVFLKLGKPDDAVKHARAALRLSPQLPQAHGALSFALALKGSYKEALEHAQRSEELGLDLPDEFVDQLTKMTVEADER